EYRTPPRGSMRPVGRDSRAALAVPAFAGGVPLPGSGAGQRRPGQREPIELPVFEFGDRVQFEEVLGRFGAVGVLLPVWPWPDRGGVTLPVAEAAQRSDRSVSLLVEPDAVRFQNGSGLAFQARQGRVVLR